jgi:hypothetical protein
VLSATGRENHLTPTHDDNFGRVDINCVTFSSTERIE